MNRAESPSLLPLELQGVTFRHRGLTLLEPMDLRLERNGKTMIMGPNGAGKSLLMRICHGLLRPTSGSVRWAGNGATPETIRQRQAMVFQRPVMLRRSALANVRYALSVQGVPRSERRWRADEAIERFGLQPIAHRPARVLSGGEQQRLALARAWALRPEILFMDEPTSALDPTAIKAVEEAVETFHSEGTRIVMTTHDLGQARRLADDVIFLVNGRLVEKAPVREFFEQPQSREAAAFVQGELVW
ncbi:phosphate ABC transporter ATP-binding protein [Franzmannia qiaohouensis]|uniref:Phosphate ABC transporter ATP-binding protein n=1 Tax=Franzmannia qiaohouensis TaxID=1329370 RepID=A0ABU1HBT7_9GAMM|nr:phosphate ABC transporter ATP-binding protein [Halomonas qiaohouensis]MDR5904926.1 phosphate ABC transporter ATP-binding protein [Halomonas qiaohouensis]